MDRPDHTTTRTKPFWQRCWHSLYQYLKPSSNLLQLCCRAFCAAHLLLCKLRYSKALRLAAERYTRFLKKSSFKHTERWLFLQEMWHQPRGMGAVWPSSRALAQTMADAIPDHAQGLVIELGAGTGAVTEALLQKISPQQLIIIEQSNTLVDYLRHRFPTIKILQGDAADLNTLLAENHLPIDAIISSLPLRVIPEATVERILQQIKHQLNGRGVFVQFTYDLVKKDPHLDEGWIRLDVNYVWGNFPPARVDVFKNQINSL